MHTNNSLVQPTQLNPNYWIERYWDRLFYYTIKRVNNPEIAKDIISDTFLAALRSKNSFKGTCSESTYLISILKRKIIDFYRLKNSKKHQAEILMSDVAQSWSGNWLEDCLHRPPEQLPQGIVEIEELQRLITEALSTIKPVHAEIFTLKTLYGIDAKSISKKLNLSRDNIWVVNHRVKKLVREYLKNRGY